MFSFLFSLFSQMLAVINKKGNSVLFGFNLFSELKNKLILPGQISWLLLGILSHTKEVTLTISCFIRLTDQVEFFLLIFSISWLFIYIFDFKPDLVCVVTTHVTVHWKTYLNAHPLDGQKR